MRLAGGRAKRHSKRLGRNKKKKAQRQSQRVLEAADAAKIDLRQQEIEEFCALIDSVRSRQNSVREAAKISGRSRNWILKRVTDPRIGPDDCPVGRKPIVTDLTLANAGLEAATMQSRDQSLTLATVINLSIATEQVQGRAIPIGFPSDSAKAALKQRLRAMGMRLTRPHKTSASRIASLNIENMIAFYDDLQYIKASQPLIFALIGLIFNLDESSLEDDVRDRPELLPMTGSLYPLPPPSPPMATGFLLLKPPSCVH